MQIHERIKKERLKAGLKPGQLAKTLGIPRTTYLYWEEKTPEVEKIKSVAKALGKPENYFFDKSDEKTVNIVEEPPVEYKVAGEGNTDKNYFLNALLEEKDRSIKRAEEVAHKMECHYIDAKEEKEKLFMALDKLQTTFDETLKQISENLKVTALSLKSNHDVLIAIGRTVRANDAEIMEALDHLEGNPVGSRQSRSHIVQKGLREGVQAGAVDKNSGKDKIRKDVKKD